MGIRCDEKGCQGALGLPAHEGGCVVAPANLALISRGLERQDEIGSLVVHELGGVTLRHVSSVHAAWSQIIGRKLGLCLPHRLHQVGDELR
jgi:hypothetical protein